eukprot:jgi/Bigna1/135211/aug1.28_g9919
MLSSPRSCHELLRIACDACSSAFTRRPKAPLSDTRFGVAFTTGRTGEGAGIEVEFYTATDKKLNGVFELLAVVCTWSELGEFQRKKRRGDDENTSVDLKLLKPISDTAFYGPEHEQKAKLALIYIQQKAERERRRKRADEATWHMFRKQKEAFDHADRVRLARLGEEGDGGTQSIIEPWDPSLPQVFAVECAKGGIRKYIAATYEDFWAKYCMMQRIERPCRLYFDLEFDKSLNRDLDGNRLVETLKRLVKEASFVAELMREHQITLNDDGILDLDSSTEDKFSRHLICHMGAVFLDNRHMGAFVKRLVGNIRDKKQTDETVAELFVNTSHKSKDDGERREIFIDEGVYTRNRCFRMLFSTKLMKKRFLRLSEMNSFRIRPGKSATTNSLLDGGKVHDAADQPLPTAKPMIQARDENASSGNSSSSSSRCSLPASTTTTMTTTTKTDDKAAPKPVSENAGNEKTMIDGKKVTICYGIGGSRYCSNIGREHKSNGIYFVATLPDGIVYQKCHDPDCRNFRSAPLKVIPRYAMDADLDSADLDAAVSLEEEVRDLS